MKNLFWTREHVENPDQLGFPMGCPAVQAIRRRPREMNAFRSEQRKKINVNGIESHFLNPF